MSEAFEPCTNEQCENEECLKRAEQGKTLEDLREELGANTIEHYRKQIDEIDESLTLVKRDRDIWMNRATEAENRARNRSIALSNFETSIRQLLEEDSERVDWESLARPLKEIGIELEQTWKANVSITVEVTVKAMNRDIAEAQLNDFRTYEVEINNGDLDTWSVEEIDWSDLEEADN
jgi:hypothetical protein